MSDPYVVVGTGRSGTSTVARLLHENMGINMGAEFKPPTSHNPKGAYEDVEFVIPTARYINGKMSFNDWDNHTRSVIRKRLEAGKPWGVKDPALAHILGQFLMYLDEPKIIRCKRDKKLAVDSFRRCYGWTKRYAEGIYDSREIMLDNTLRRIDHLPIDFGDKDQVPDDSLLLGIQRRFSNKKVYLAILNNGWLRREIVYNRIGTWKQTPGVELFWENPNLSWAEPICSNRAKIVQRFLQSDCDFLLMIDDDIIPYANPIEYVYADKDIVGFPAKVRQKGMALNWVAYYELDNVGYLPCDFSRIENRLADLVSVDIVGTGAILIKRKVLEKVKKPFLVEFDKNGVNKYGTDFAFCRRAKKAGFEIYTAPNCICEHIKEVGMLDIQQYDDSDNRDESVNKYQLPFGEWSVSQRDWQFVKDAIQDKKPKKILEFGCGLSSLLMSEHAEVIAYETEEKYAKKVAERKLRGNKLKIRNWDGKAIKGKLGQYDMAFVDGPKGTQAGGMGREASIQYASKHSDTVIVHDARREDEWRLQMTYLKPDFKLSKVSGYHQTCCHLWERN